MPDAIFFKVAVKERGCFFNSNELSKKGVTRFAATDGFAIFIMITRMRMRMMMMMIMMMMMMMMVMMMMMMMATHSFSQFSSSKLPYLGISPFGLSHMSLYQRHLLGITYRK